MSLIKRTLNVQDLPSMIFVQSGIQIDDIGLVLHCGPVLTRRTQVEDLQIYGNLERLAVLLSVAYNKAIGYDVIPHIKSASGLWHSNQRALANIRLLFAGIPMLTYSDDVNRVRMAEHLLDKGISPINLCKLLDTREQLVRFDPSQPRVPAGDGRPSGRWESIWNSVQEWLNKPIPEYDTETGEQVGTRTRGRALATNPATVGIVGTAALLGAEALLPMAAEEAEFAVASARGLASQARILKELGLERNTQAVITTEGRAIPDALTDTLSVEIKDTAYVSKTAQV